MKRNCRLGIKGSRSCGGSPTKCHGQVRITPFHTLAHSSAELAYLITGLNQDWLLIVAAPVLCSSNLQQKKCHTVEQRFASM